VQVHRSNVPQSIREAKGREKIGSRIGSFTRSLKHQSNLKKKIVKN
jgi:hypothetical protein